MANNPAAPAAPAFDPFKYKMAGEFTYRGVLYSGGNVVDINMAADYTADPSDVLVTAYPKSGTTWMSAIVPLIIHEGDQEKVQSMGHMMMRVPYVDLDTPQFPSALKLVNQRSPPRMMKTHLRYEFYQKQVETDKMKVIVMMRNPKDTLVSCYYFYKDHPRFKGFDGDFHDFFKLAKVGHVHHGDIFDWYKQWWPQTKRENVLAVKYEDLIRDCDSELSKIAKFCDKDLDSQTIQKIAHSCQFKQMKNDSLFSMKFDKGGSSIFFRKGEVGGWKNYFTEEESNWVDEMCRKHFDPMGLKFDYE